MRTALLPLALVPLVIAAAFRQARGAGIENGLDMTNSPRKEIVRIVMSGSATSWCSGTVVGPNVVLTAAHCIAGAGGSPKSISVTIDHQPWSIDPRNCLAHPKFNLYHDSPDQYPYDLAVLMLPARFDAYIPIEVGIDESSVVGAEVKLGGFADSDDIQKTGTNQIKAYYGGMLIFEGLKSDRVGSTGNRQADGTEVSIDPGDSGGPILAAGGDSVLGLSTRILPPLSRDYLNKFLGNIVGRTIADDLDRAGRGPNPKVLSAGPLLSIPENLSFLDSAKSKGYDIRLIQGEYKR